MQDEQGIEEAMGRAVALAAGARRRTPPNPWVGAVVVAADGEQFDGATEPPGGRHAEIVALEAAGGRARGATVVTTLEPCSHHGRTAPCAEALIEAGVARVVVGIVDPDPQVAGRGIGRLRAGGIDVEVGVRADEVRRQLAAYLTHRREGRPHVVLKLAATLDGRTAAPDGTSRWITGSQARADAHQLRADSDVVLVGAGTVRTDDPALTVRAVPGDDPTRAVAGSVPAGAAVEPAIEVRGEPAEVLAALGAHDVLQVMVEGGATLAGAFHRAGLVDRYVLYVAPALLGGDDGHPVLAGTGAPTMSELDRGHFTRFEQLGDDLCIEFEPERDARPAAAMA